MARKAKPRPPAEEHAPSLDDPRWQPLITEHKLRTERIGNPSLAAVDLHRDLKTGRVRSMSRRLVDSVPELTPEGHWDDHVLSYETGAYGLHGLHVVPPRRPSDTSTGVLPVRSATDRVFFIWGPNMAHPRKPEPEIDRQSEKVRLHKPGKPEAYNWPLVVAAELIRRAKAGEKDPTASKMIAHCEGVLPGGHSPGLKEMQKLLKRLLTGQI
jgi:hypothetical protein